MKKTSLLSVLVLVFPVMALGGSASARAAQSAPAKPAAPATGPQTAPSAGTPVPAPGGSGAASSGPPATVGVTPPADYVIGPDDVLSIIFWRDKDLSVEAVVRPDGRISLPLLNDVVVAGLTPDQLRENLTKQSQRYVEDPNVSVIVKQINSRKVFITGQVTKPGTYLLTGPTTVLQLIAIAGGLNEYADQKGIVVMRTEGGKPSNFKFNYKDVVKQKNVKQNIELKPGDTIVVP